MLHLAGCPITPEDARHLIATLIADGGPDAMSAAAMIGNGLDGGLFGVGLTTEQKDAILSVLEDTPPGLEELRGVLAREHRARTGTLYLIHFPRGIEAIHNIIRTSTPQPGDEILPGWILFGDVEPNEQVINGQAVRLEAWVKPKPHGEP